MIKRFSVSATLVLFLVGGLAAPMAYAKEGESKKNDRKTRVVCKRVTRVGSHFTRRVCLTKVRWDEMERAAQQVETDNTPRSQGEGG